MNVSWLLSKKSFQLLHTPEALVCYIYVQIDIIYYKFPITRNDKFGFEYFIIRGSLYLVKVQKVVKCD